jgi:hypothetical protein
MPKITNNIARTVARVKESSNVLRWQAARSHVSISKQLAPVLSGYMRDHIRIVEIPRGNGIFDYMVVSEALYSLFVEFGTVNIDAQPFFMPGYESAVVQLKATARALVQSLIAGSGATIVNVGRQAA